MSYEFNILLEYGIFKFYIRFLLSLFIFKWDLFDYVLVRLFSRYLFDVFYVIGIVFSIRDL